MVIFHGGFSGVKCPRLFGNFYWVLFVGVCSEGNCPGRTHHRGSTGLAEPLLRTTATTNMAAANFVVITNGEGCTLTGTANIDQ